MNLLFSFCLGFIFGARFKLLNQTIKDSNIEKSLEDITTLNDALIDENINLQNQLEMLKKSLLE